MRSFRCFLLALALLVTCPSIVSAYPWIDMDATYTAPGVGVRWYHGESGPSDPTWVGFDVVRRTIGEDCGPPITVNPEPVLRGHTSSEPYDFLDTPPAGVTYEYRIIFVDANRTQVFPPGCSCGGAHDYVTSPPDAVPLTVGQLVDWGWTLAIQPCA